MTRFERQRLRIETVYIMLRCFSHYNMMHMYMHGARNGNTDMHTVGVMTSVFNKMYKMELDVFDMLVFSNDMADKAIEEYSKLNELIDSYFPSERYRYSKECIISALSYLYQHDITLRNRYIDFIFFIRHVEEKCHLRERGSIASLKNKCIETCMNDNEVYTRHCDSVHFRRTFIRIEETLERISEIRKKRKRKKDFYGTFKKKK